jgi:hypothetical protein
VNITENAEMQVAVVGGGAIAYSDIAVKAAWGALMHFSLAAVFAGACLLCMYAALYFLGQEFQERELTATMAADPTIAPNNPSWVVIAILPEGEEPISNDGGSA